MNVNFAERAHNHNWKLDPIVRSLLDTDFYKLLMLQFIWKNFPAVPVTSEVHNRTVRVRLAERISVAALRDQLDHVRTLRLRRSELVWLAGNTFYGVRQIFSPEFLDWLEHDFRLSDYEITEADGQLVIRFSGLWTEVTMWEVYSLAIVSEMKTRSALSTLNELELDVLYARAKTRLWDKIELLRPIQGLRLSDFGTRRRHSFLWQEYCVEALATILGDNFIGTSNTALAYKHNLEAIGTNAHELPMAMAAIASRGPVSAKSDEDLRQSQYEVLRLWQQSYGGELLITLPDTFGTTQFLQGAPDWVARWTGERVDSKDPFVAGDEYIAWLVSRSQDPRTKRLIASDGLDASTIADLHAYFNGRIRFSAGWGTLLTNDFRDCHPRGEDTFEPISLVCKLTSADGIPTVKLSDNPSKATGPADAIDRYRRVFGSPVLEEVPVLGVALRSLYSPHAPLLPAPPPRLCLRTRRSPRHAARLGLGRGRPSHDQPPRRRSTCPPTSPPSCATATRSTPSSTSAPSPTAGATKPSTSSRDTQAPDHFIDMEYADLVSPLPRKRYDFIRDLAAIQLLHPALPLTPEKRRPAALAGRRGLAAAQGRSPRVPQARRRQPGHAPVQTAILFDAGWLGHYVGDGSMPLHTSMQYNGWNGPNPNHYTTEHHIHSQFETAFVSANIKPSDVAPLVAASKPQVYADEWTSYLDYLHHTHTFVEKVYQLDKANGFIGAGTPEAKAFTEERLAAGAIELRNLIDSAWVHSADPVEEYQGK